MGWSAGEWAYTSAQRAGLVCMDVSLLIQYKTAGFIHDNPLPLVQQVKVNRKDFLQMAAQRIHHYYTVEFSGPKPIQVRATFPLHQLNTTITKV